MACYPYLGCFDRELPVADHWGVKHDVLCAGKDSTYRFVKDVIDELCEIFTDGYFHIGGDEVPKHRWHLCHHCQAKIKELGLKDEEELQCYFMNRINDYCKSKGKQAFMWSWDLKDDKLLNEDLGFTKCGDINTSNAGNESVPISLTYTFDQTSPVITKFEIADKEASNKDYVMADNYGFFFREDRLCSY